MVWQLFKDDISKHPISTYLIFILLFVIVSSKITYSTVTYQEDENYVVCSSEENWSSTKPCYNTHDGDWSTCGAVGSATDDDPHFLAFVEFTYNKPSYAKSTSVFQVGESQFSIKNLSIPSSCWDFSDSILKFRINLYSDCGGVSACFTPDSKVLTTSGYKNIAYLKEGEDVYSFLNGYAIPEKITHIYKYNNSINNNTIFTIYLSDGSILNVTWNQKIYTERGIIIAKKLKTGDKLVKIKNKMKSFSKIINITVNEYIGYVYELSINNTHNFIINDYLVHNQVPPPGSSCSSDLTYRTDIYCYNGSWVLMDSYSLGILCETGMWWNDTESDSIPPTTTISPDGHSWTNQDVSFTLTCSDSGSGCNQTYYKIINDGDSCGTTGYSTGTSGTVTCTSGSTCQKRVCYYSTDNAGNTETTKQSNVFYIDKISPSTTASAINSDSSTYTFGTWTNSPYVNVTLSCSDSGSGCSSTKYCTDTDNTCTPSTSYSSPVKITTQGTSYIRYYSTDNAGNTEATKSQTIKIDSIPPSLTLESPQNTTYSSQYIDINYTTSDTNLDSCWYVLDSTTYDLPNCENTTITVSSGFHTFEIHSNDTLGNENSTNVNFTANYHLYYSQGNWTSQIKDLGTEKVLWYIYYTSTTPSGTSIQMYYRAGNTSTPDTSWTDWIQFTNGQQIGIETRYVQILANLTTSDQTITPTISQIRIVYS